MHGITIPYAQHCQAMLECGMCELAHFFFHDRPPGGGRLFDMVCISANLLCLEKSKGKMLNMLLLIREMFYYLKK